MNNAPHEELRAANEDAARFYRRQLLGAEASGPREYLAGRGFEALLDETPWAVGYAPRGWTVTYEHLAGLGYSDDTLLAAGLASRTRHGNLIDRFRDRITFGIRSASGEIVGFTARRGPGAPSDCPKYLNTPTTPIYSKSHRLFGWAESDALAPAATTTVVTEGPFDAIAVALSHLKGTEPPMVLALCGTALTSEHVRIVASEATTRVTLALDSDAAGRGAVSRAYEALARHDLEVTISRFPTSSDAAELLVSGGPAAVRHNIEISVPAVRVIVDDHIDSWETWGRGGEADLCCLRSTVRALGEVRPSDAAAVTVRLAARLGFGTATVTRELLDGLVPDDSKSTTGRRPAARQGPHPGARPPRSPLGG